MLGVLAVVAVLVVAIMIQIFGKADNASDAGTQADPTGPAVTVIGTQRSATHASSTRPKPSKPRTRSPSSPRTGPVSCPTTAPCVLPDDVGNAVQALNAYRMAHGRRTVIGSVTRAAQDCAVHNGDASSCPAGYFWEPVGRSGREVIDKIATSGHGGKAWLLNPDITAIQVGWAYLPSSKTYECVLVSSG